MIKFCSQCSSKDLKMVIDVTIAAPQTMYQKISKSSFRGTEIEILGTDWSRIAWLCNSCGNMENMSRNVEAAQLTDFLREVSKNIKLTRQHMEKQIEEVRKNEKAAIDRRGLSKGSQTT